MSSSAMRFLGKLDASLAVTRPLWLWLGQVALVILGAHLAVDLLDDSLGRLLSDVPIDWPTPQTPFDVGRWTAVALELLVAGWAVCALARATAERVKSPREWAKRWSFHNLLGPAFWLPVGLAGSWTIAMAVEDLIPHDQAAPWIGSGVGLVVAWRLVATGFLTLVLQAPLPRRRIEGWLFVVPLGVVGWFAARHGLPIWGWLP